MPPQGLGPGVGFLRAEDERLPLHWGGLEDGGFLGSHKKGLPGPPALPTQGPRPGSLPTLATLLSAVAET